MKSHLKIVNVNSLSIRTAKRSSALSPVFGSPTAHGLPFFGMWADRDEMSDRLTLLTKNTRHFQMIPELEVIRPY
jgi:hypothetical protein